jgi:hypothetical protein
MQVEYERQLANVYMLSESLNDVTWIAQGFNPAWRPHTKSITYLCQLVDADMSSLCEYSLEQKVEKSIVDKFAEENYVWSSDGSSILFIDLGGESEPSYISVMDIDTGHWIHLHKIFGSRAYRGLIWASK